MNQWNIFWSFHYHFCHHFWVGLLLLCCCTHPKVMTKMAKKCSTDQRFIQKRIHTLTETTVDVALSRSRYLFFCYHIGQNDHFSRGTPSAPLDLKAAIVSSRFVTLSWSPPKTSKEPLNGYSIYYKQVKNFLQPFIQNFVQPFLKNFVHFLFSLASKIVRSVVEHLQPM